MRSRQHRRKSKRVLRWVLAGVFSLLAIAIVQTSRSHDRSTEEEWEPLASFFPETPITHQETAIQFTEERLATVYDEHGTPIIGVVVFCCAVAVLAIFVVRRRRKLKRKSARRRRTFVHPEDEVPLWLKQRDLQNH